MNFKEKIVPFTIYFLKFLKKLKESY